MNRKAMGLVFATFTLVMSLLPALAQQEPPKSRPQTSIGINPRFKADIVDGVLTFTVPETGATHTVDLRKNRPLTPRVVRPGASPQQADRRTPQPQLNETNPDFHPIVSADGTMSFVVNGVVKTVNLRKDAPAAPKTSKPIDPRQPGCLFYQFVGSFCEYSELAGCVGCSDLYYSLECDQAIICYTWPGCSCGDGCFIIEECVWHQI